MFFRIALAAPVSAGGAPAKSFRLRRGWLLLAGLVLALSTTQAARVVWIDTDLSLGSPLREVDDAYALIVALHSPELSVAGISTTYGNAPLAGTTGRTRTLLNQLGLAIPIFPGATGPGDFDRRSAASEALAVALRKNRRLVYVALGPLTDLAAFLALHPEQAGRLEQIVMVAGKSPGATLGFGPQETFRIHDANFVKDPAAVRAVLRSPIPILIAPIETSSRLMIAKPDLEALRKSGATGHYLAERSGIWLWFWTHLARARGGPIFDALAVAAAARPSLLTINTRYAAIEADGSFLVRQKRSSGGRKVRFCSDFSPAVKELILRRLSGRPEKSSSARPGR